MVSSGISREKHVRNDVPKFYDSIVLLESFSLRGRQNFQAMKSTLTWCHGQTVSSSFHGPSTENVIYTEDIRFDFAELIDGCRCVIEDLQGG